MAIELREIPPAPRRVRAAAVLIHRWPLGAAGALLGVYGSFLTLMLWFGSQGSYALLDAQLDRDAVPATGIVEEVETVGGLWTGADEYRRVTHRFTDPRGNVSKDRSYTTVHGLQVGDEIEIEHLNRLPYRSRIVGGQLVLAGVDYWRPALYGLAIPGLLLMLLYAWSALRHRQLLRVGDLAIAEVLCVVPVRRISPQMLRVHYRFRDHQARLRDGTHWIRARSALGERLSPETDPGPSRPRESASIEAGQLDFLNALPDNLKSLQRTLRCVVAHDRATPDRNVLVAAEHFRRIEPDLTGIDLGELGSWPVDEGPLPGGGKRPDGTA